MALQILLRNARNIPMQEELHKFRRFHYALESMKTTMLFISVI